MRRAIAIAVPVGLVVGALALGQAFGPGSSQDRTSTGATTAAAAPAAAAAGPTATTVVVALSKPARRALRRLGADLHDGQSQVDVLAQHTVFLEQALADDDVRAVRVDAEHLANIALGRPNRDLDGDGVAANPGDGVGLLGDRGYVTAATAPFLALAADRTVPAQDRGRAVGAQASLDLLETRLGTVVRQAEEAATVAKATDATEEIHRIRAAVDDVRTTYSALRDSLSSYALGP